MIQPKTYPRMVGRALMLESDPFIAMTEDDNPWIEGAFFTLCLGMAVGVAQIIGSLLTTVSMPPLDQMFAVLPPAIQQSESVATISLDATRNQIENLLAINWDVYGFEPTVAAGNEPSAVTSTLRQGWFAVRNLSGLAQGWTRLLALVITPFTLIAIWFIYGLMTYYIAKYFGGIGSLNQTLGSTSLMVAPAVLLLLTGIPFVSVSWLLLIMWGLLIVYRSVEVTHELDWKNAALTASIPLAVLGVLGIFAIGGAAVLGAIV